MVNAEQIFLEIFKNRKNIVIINYHRPTINPVLKFVEWIEV